jgi:2-oxoglutarate ferredoxin oxidoreductase subunit delta
MANMKLYAERCKNCQYCIGACPVHAISVSEYKNKQGFKVVKVDEKRCIGCGTCYTVCPDYVFEICQ